MNFTTQENKNWANNPQYYFSIKKDSAVMICLIQNDGRLTSSKFPYPETTKKSCLIISKAKGMSKLTEFDNNNVVKMSIIRQHRENSLYLNLKAGEYIISACTFKQGEIGQFYLEIFFEDSYIDSDYDDSNFRSKLLNTKIERLDDKENKVKGKLIIYF